MGAECNLLPVLWVKINMPEAAHKVHSAEPLESGQGVESVIDDWEGVGILACHRIDLVTINAKSKGSNFFSSLALLGMPRDYWMAG